MGFFSTMKSFFSEIRKDTLDDVPEFRRVSSHKFATNYVLANQTVFIARIAHTKKTEYITKRTEVIGTKNTEVFGFKIAKEIQTKQVEDLTSLTRHILEPTPEMLETQEYIASLLKGKAIMRSQKIQNKISEEEVKGTIQVTPFIVESECTFIITWRKHIVSLI